MGLHSGVTVVAAGYWHTMVVMQDGSVWGTGYNRFGTLGDGTTTRRLIFSRLLSSGVTAVAAGWYHSMVMKQDGSVWCTGHNNRGQLGDGTTTERTTFVEVITACA